MEPTQFDILEEKVLLALNVIQKLKERNSELEAEMRKFPGQIEDLELKLMTEQEKAASISMETSQKSTQIEEAQAKIQSLQAELNQKNDIIAEKNEAIRQYESEFLERKANLAQAGEKIQSLISRLDEKNLEELVA